MSLVFFDALTRIGPRPRTHGKHPWSLEHLVDEMQHCSISGAMVTCTSQQTYDPQHENHLLIETLADHDYLFPVWHVTPHWTDGMPEPGDLVKQLDKHNVRMVSMTPNTNGYPVLSRMVTPLLGALEEAAIPVLLDYNSVLPLEIEEVCERHPGLPLILHGARWGQGNAILPLVRNYKNVHTTFNALQLNYGVEWLVSKGCADQLIFGSNAPEMSAGAHRFYIDYADISEEDRIKVAGGNLTRLLKGLTPPREIVNGDEDEVMAEARQGKPLSTHVVDIHAHILDEGLNTAGASYPMINGGPRGTVDLAERMGVDAIGLMSWIGPVSVHAERGNQCVKDALDAAPDTWWGLATFDVMHESADEMRAKMTKLFDEDRRFIALKPYPQYGIPYSDPRYDCWWEFANERKLYVGTHPHNWFQPGEFESMCSRFPDMTVVAYHCGASYDIADTCIELANKYPNFMIEITLTPVCGGIIDYLVEGAGVDRVMYGSDLPMRDPRQQLGWVVYSKLGLEDKKKVLGLNAQKLVDRVRADQAALAGA